MDSTVASYSAKVAMVDWSAGLLALFPTVRARAPAAETLSAVCAARLEREEREIGLDIAAIDAARDERFVCQFSFFVFTPVS